MYIICTYQINFYDLHHRIRYLSLNKSPNNMNYFVVLRVTGEAIAKLAEGIALRR